MRLRGEGTGEYVMIELQGVLEAGGALGGLPLGTLRTTAPCSLVVGTHQLSGTRSSLKKPLLVTRTTPDGVVVLGVVREKFVFKSRPNTLAVSVK